MQTSEANTSIRVVSETLQRVLRRGRNGEEPFVLDDQGAEALRRAIDDELGSRALFRCVESLLLSAELLRTQLRSPSAAESVFAITDRPIVVDAMEALNKARESELREAGAASAKRFTGSRSAARRAPRHDDVPPAGSFKADLLNPLKRL